MSRRSARREEARRKLNIAKVIVATILVSLTFLFVFFLFINKDEETTEKEPVVENKVEDEVVEETVQNKTVEEVVESFGGSIIEKIKDDTCYASVDGKECTIYASGESYDGRIKIWDGTAAEPKINEDGTIDINTAQELKWVADKVINGEKNFSGVTINLRQHIDLGARKTENGWEGPDWTPIVGFLDELPKDDKNKNLVVDDSIVVDESMDVKQENLKRFAGHFNGNEFTIRGMKVDSSKDYQGLFGYQVGTIENLTISYSYVKGNDTVGALVALNGGIIKRCSSLNNEVVGNNKVGALIGVAASNSNLNSIHTADNVTGNKYVGGVIGYVNNNVKIYSASSRGTTLGKEYVGGILGISFYGNEISHIQTTHGKVEGEEYVGGLVGYSQAQIEKSYILDKVTVKGNKYVGGLVGANHSVGSILNSSSAAKVIVLEDNAGGIAGINYGSILNVFNIGNIDSTGASGIRVGGICGENASESSITSAYSVGIILYKDSAEGIVGIDFGTTSKAYYLDSSLDNKAADKALERTEESMKNEILNDLGEAFVKDEYNVNNGYPILSWQKDIV